MTLAAQQTGLLALLKGREPPEPTSYLADVAASRGLRVLRQIAISWRELDIQSSCPLTAALLRRQGRWRAEIVDFNDGAHESTAIEDLRDAFIDRQLDGSDQLVASVAALERALVAASTGRPGVVEIPFDRDPGALLEALVHGGAVDVAAVARGRFVVSVGAALPGLLLTTEVGTA